MTEFSTLPSKELKAMQEELKFLRYYYENADCVYFDREAYETKTYSEATGDKIPDGY